MKNTDYLEMMAQGRTLQSLEIHRLIGLAGKFLAGFLQKDRGYAPLTGAKAS